MTWIKIKQFFCTHGQYRDTRSVMDAVREAECVRCGKEFCAAEGGEFMPLSDKTKKLHTWWIKTFAFEIEEAKRLNKQNKK